MGGRPVNASEHLNEIAPALVAAQRTLRNPTTDSTATVPMKSGGKYSYKYLSLPGLLEHVRSAYRELGLALMQEVEGDSAGVAVTTRIVHLSGQWIEFGPLFLPASGTPQDRGSAITYARRYALAAAVGLASDEDDDGAKAARSTSAGEAFDQARPRPTNSSDEVGAASEESEPARSETGEGSVAGEGHAPAPDPEEGGPSEVETPASGPATPEQWDRLLRLYSSKVSTLKAAGVAKQSEVTFGKAEELILAKAGA